ncbi:hypothetical protein [Flavobacterium chungangensis]|uniref:Uncharacterized protein n=1 Tax=Flavobacterium chungangensis TaxID=2708132 RepID=A0ABV8ZK08_9FLAO
MAQSRRHLRSTIKKDFGELGAILIQQKIKRYVPSVKPLEPVVPVDSLAVSKDTLKPAVVKPE